MCISAATTEGQTELSQNAEVFSSRLIKKATVPKGVSECALVLADMPTPFIHVVCASMAHTLPHKYMSVYGGHPPRVPQHASKHRDVSLPAKNSLALGLSPTLPNSASACQPHINPLTILLLSLSLSLSSMHLLLSPDKPCRQKPCLMLFNNGLQVPPSSDHRRFCAHNRNPRPLRPPRPPRLRSL